MRFLSLLGVVLIVGALFADASQLSYEPLLDRVVQAQNALQETFSSLSTPSPSSHNAAETSPAPELPEVPELQEIPELPEVLQSGKIYTKNLISPKSHLPEKTVVSSSDWEFSGMVLEENFDVKDLESTTLDFLQKVFEKNQDPQVMNAILQEMVDSYQFVAAKQFIEKLTPKLLREVEIHLYLTSAFNSFSLASENSFTTLQALVDTCYQNAQLSKEEYDWYSSLISLMQKDYDKFFQYSKSFKQTPYTAFAGKLATLQAQIANQSDMPAYYFDTLVAVELFNQGYFQPAKVLALSALAQNKDYILPYQILAYANFLTNAWDAAIGYLTTLSSLEPSLQQKYDFLMGVASYWNKKYAESVLKLSQVKDTTYRLDAERYLALNYQELKQYAKLLSSWEKILGYNQLQKSDFFSYFYQVLFVPYFQGVSPTLYLQNPGLTQKYLARCTELFTGKESVLCSYGKIGYQLISGTTDAEGFEKALESLADHYPQGYLFHALGEWYIQQGALEQAKPYLIKAIGMATTSQEALQIKNLLQKVM
jgi:tetratricopeptide (TPR) repeat protein